eukprot:TRINITY_DN265_c0_g1_i3.p1 TRINITY_DN265_c0_g1~~TRINITY_DN265_c0_g1_i3.p1  ORF type:complete len:694 (+),score=172.30 TRINITY_DN265_c0_g1_i3:128-2209(+)
MDEPTNPPQNYCIEQEEAKLHSFRRTATQATVTPCGLRVSIQKKDAAWRQTQQPIRSPTDQLQTQVQQPSMPAQLQQLQLQLEQLQSQMQQLQTTAQTPQPQPQQQGPSPASQKKKKKKKKKKQQARNPPESPATHAAPTPLQSTLPAAATAPSPPSPESRQRKCAQLVALLADTNTTDNAAIQELERASAEGYIHDGDTLNSGFGARGTRLLGAACAAGKALCARWLLGRGADPNVADGDGSTALHLAAQCADTGAVDVVHCLLDHGAHPLALNSFRESALLLASLFSPDTILPILARFCADLPKARRELALLKPSIALACEKNYLTFLQALESVLGPPCKELWTGTTGEPSPLHIAAQHGSADVAVFLMRVLTRFDVSTASNRLHPCNGHTALGLACAAGDFALVERLCAFSCIDVNAGTYESPLHVACRRGRWQIVNLLLEHHADPCLKNCCDPKEYEFGELHGDSPAHIAAREGHVECLRSLVEQCPRVVLQANRWGNVCLHVACMANAVLVARLLLECDATCDLAGQQVAFSNNRADQPLHYAYRHNPTGDVEALASLMLLHGADGEAENSCGQRPHECAASMCDARRLRAEAHARDLRLVREQAERERAALEQRLHTQQEELERRERDARDHVSALCVVCMEHAKDCLLKPCGHLACCYYCAQQVQRHGGCPICRADVDTTERVFLV